MGEHCESSKIDQQSKPAVGDTKSPPPKRPGTLEDRKQLGKAPSTKEASDACTTRPRAHEPVAGEAQHADNQDVSEDELNAETQVAQSARRDIIDGYKGAVDIGFDAVAAGMNRAIRALRSPEKPPTSSAWQDFVSLGAGLAIAGAGGLMAGWVGKTIAQQLVSGGNAKAEGAVEEMIQEAVVRILSPDTKRSRSAIPEIREAFTQQVEGQLIARKIAFNKGWPDLAGRLTRMSSERVKKYSEAAVGDPNGLIASVALETMVAWTNFLARAMHGAMAADPWEHHRGHIPLKGAKHEVEARAANVDPNKMDWALEDTQRPQQREHFGLLEIHLWLDGRIVALPGYGIRLDNVGPNVRQAFQRAGVVRDLPINKVVRFYDRRERLSSPKPVLGNSLLISADGHVRRGLWKGGEDRIRAVAERVQGISLEHLDV